MKIAIGSDKSGFPAKEAIKAYLTENANVLTMGGWIVGPEMAVEMVKTFPATEWCQDLEDWRKENMKKFSAQVKAIEDRIYGE